MSTDSSLKRILLSRIHDPKLDAHVRLEAYHKYTTVAYPDEIEDAVNRYEQLIHLESTAMPVSESTFQFMQLLAVSPHVPPQWRYNLIMALFFNNHFVCYDLMLTSVHDMTMTDAYRADFLLLLYATDDYYEEAETALVEGIRQLIVDKVNGVTHYWYRFITDLVACKPLKLVGMNGTLVPQVTEAFLDQCLSAYLLNDRLTMMWRLQCAQLLLMRHEGRDTQVVDLLTGMVKDHYEDETIVGEIYDILIRCDKENPRQWEEALLAYGSRHTDKQSYAHNTQNVHFFADQAIQFLDVLYARSGKKPDELELDYGQFESWIYTLMVECQLEESTQTAILETLSFIYHDSSRLGHHRLSPRAMAVLLMPYLNEEENYRFLLSELKEMNGTCTTGHYVRMIGIIASESDTPFRISFEQQLVSNIEGRLYSRLKQLPSETYELVIDQVMEPVDERSEEYRVIVQEIFSHLQSELRSEFVGEGHITSEKFDTVFDHFRSRWLSSTS